MKRSEIPRDSGAVVGCYSVHLYCQHPEHGFSQGRHVEPGEFTGDSETDCLTAARIYGWWVGRANGRGERAVLCPYHAREVPR